MSKLQRSLLIIFLVFLILFGLACLAYPPFSSWYNEKHQAEIHTQFHEAIENTDQSDITAAKESAMLYNKRLAKKEFSYAFPEENGYFEELNLAGNGIMGYIRIPTINVNLPIYHGTSEKTLSMGAGHLHETSLPVGGPSTHAAISAHSGMASSTLFSELERVKLGDYFYIDILGETLTYKVDKIKAVLPEDTKDLEPQKNEDLVTLITCTPYGINTHRLLVRGSRVHDQQEIAAAPDTNTASSDGVEPELSVRTENWLKCIFFGGFGGLVLSLSIVLTVIFISRKKSEKETENNEKNDDPSADPAADPHLGRMQP